MKNFIKGSSILMIGDLLTKVISVLYLIPLVRINAQITVLMTNLLVPFGFFVVFSTIGINLILTNQLVKAKDESETKAALFDVGIILIVLTIIGCFIMLLVSPTLMHKVELNEQYAKALISGSRGLIFGVVLFSLTAYIRSILMAYGDYKVISITYITEQIVRVGIILIGSYYTLILKDMDVVVVVYIIVVAILISMCSTLLVYVIYFIKNKYLEKFKYGNYRFSKKNIKHLIVSALILFTGGIYITVFDLIDLLLLNNQMLGQGFSIAQIDQVKGEYFTLSLKIVMVPISISAAFIQVMIKQVGESKDNKSEINKIIYIVSIYSIFMLGGIMLLGENVYGLFYGQASTGIIAVQSLIIPVYITKNVIGGYIITNHGKFQSIIISTIIIIVGKVAFDLMLFNTFGIFGYILSSVFSLLLGTLYLIWSNKNLFNSLKKVIFDNFILYIKAIVLIVISYLILINIPLQNNIILIIIQGIIYLILFVALYLNNIKAIERS